MEAALCGECALQRKRTAAGDLSSGPLLIIKHPFEKQWGKVNCHLKHNGRPDHSPCPFSEAYFQLKTAHRCAINQRLQPSPQENYILLMVRSLGRDGVFGGTESVAVASRRDQDRYGLTRSLQQQTTHNSLLFVILFPSAQRGWITRKEQDSCQDDLL